MNKQGGSKNVVGKYLLTKRQARLRKNLQLAIIDRNAERVVEIAKVLGLDYTVEQIEQTFIV
tara:strand:- start:3173 stop:3358 length:186 start_codon:yes stop_codon:yes gene_type:complete